MSLQHSLAVLLVSAPSRLSFQSCCLPESAHKKAKKRALGSHLLSDVMLKIHWASMVMLTSMIKNHVVFTMLTISRNDRTIQVAGVLRRSLIQATAQSRIWSEIESGCAGFHLPGTLKPPRMKTEQPLWATTAWLSWLRKSFSLHPVLAMQLNHELPAESSQFPDRWAYFPAHYDGFCAWKRLSVKSCQFSRVFLPLRPTNCLKKLKFLLSWSPQSVVCYLSSSLSSISLSPLFQGLHNQACLRLSLHQTVWMLCE